MNTTIGFIGCGNMGGALALAVAKSPVTPTLLLSDAYAPLCQSRAKQTGGKVSDNLEIAKTADILVLAVKPQGFRALIDSLAPHLASREKAPLIITIAAGLAMEQLYTMGIPRTCPMIRIMPNLPVSVGEGMLLYTCSDNAEDYKELFLALFAEAGQLAYLPEDKIDAASALSGCGPAFVCLFLEALADGAVACGLSRKDALLFAEQTLLGTAKHLKETETHPAILKDAVCSPGGTTICGVRALEDGGFRSAAMHAVLAAYERTLALKKECP